jgi:hypothetical protein
MRRVAFVLLLSLIVPTVVWGEELSLHERIDELVEREAAGTVWPLADDAEFFRRVNLDLAGSIPTADETRQFLSDTNPDKRAAAIDRLLASPRYAEQMTDQFQIMLMEQRGTHADWEKFLKGAFEQNRPWNEIARDILKPVKDDESRRGAAYFHTRRLEKVGENPTDYPGLTRDVGRLFLGVDLQCAECHDHLFIDDYKQRDFQGLFAVYSNLSIGKEGFPAIDEKILKEPLRFVSVFESEPKLTGPRVPFGTEFPIPEAPPTGTPDKDKDKAKEQSPTAGPSPMAQLADAIVANDQKLFRQNMANRVWFLLMGRGLVEPLDQFHSANPASNPELLELLSQEFAAHGFDLKWLIREIVLSKAWQRSSLGPAGVEGQVTGDRDASDSDSKGKGLWRQARQRNLSAHQMFLSTLQATGNMERLRGPSPDAPGEAYTKLKAKFVAAMATEPKEPTLGYVPSVKEAAFLSNDGDLLDLLKPHPGNLMEKLIAAPDAEIPDAIYLHLFARLPDDEEREFITTTLKQAKADRQVTLRDLVWAMLSSTEFRLNH